MVAIARVNATHSERAKHDSALVERTAKAGGRTNNRAIDTEEKDQKDPKS